MGCVLFFFFLQQWRERLAGVSNISSSPRVEDGDTWGRSAGRL